MESELGSGEACGLTSPIWEEWKRAGGETEVLSGLLMSGMEEPLDE